MANPNIVNVTEIYGKSAGVSATIATQTLVTNAAASGKILKINMVTAANVQGTTTADLNVWLLKNGATSYHIASTIAVPADATLVVLSKDTSIYLEENDSIQISSSHDNYIEAVCSYEEIV